MSTASKGACIRRLLTGSLCLLLPCLLMGTTLAANAARTVISLDQGPWQLTGLEMGQGERRGLPQRVGTAPRSISVRIPDDVQLTDFVKDPLGQSSDLIDVNKKEWWYTRTFPTPHIPPGQEVRLVFDGVDYFADVWLNGKKLGSHEGAYTRFEYDITDDLSSSGINYLAVRVTSPWKVVGRSHYEFMKGEFDETWDALPGPGQVVFPLGLHRSVRLEISASTRIEDCDVSTLALAGTVAKLRIAAHIVSKRAAAGTLRITLVPENSAGAPLHLAPLHYSIPAAPGGGTTVTLRADVPDAKLWWTWDTGPQNLYRAEVRLFGNDGRLLDSTSTIFGIRTIQRDASMVYRLNGRKILLRGANYPMSRLYPASTDRWTYERDLLLARNANFNSILNYTVIEKEDFYDLADRLGILLFIELPFNQEGPIDALNKAYPRRQAFLDWSASEVRQIVNQLRNHPSIGVWAPVSEVTENTPEIKVSWDERVGEAKDGYNLFLKIMQHVIEQADPNALYFRSYCDFGEHHYWEGSIFDGTTYDQIFDASTGFVSEYGAEAAFPLEDAARVVDVNRFWTAGSKGLSPVNLPVNMPSFTYLQPWQSFGVDFTTTAIGLNVTRKIASYADYVNASQVYQAFIYGYAGDTFRRKLFSPINGIRSWMFKDFTRVPIGGFGVIDAFDTPTRAYYEQKRTYAPVTLSFAMRTPLASVPSGAHLTIPVWVSNTGGALNNISISYTLYDLKGTAIQSGRTTASVSADQAVQVGTADLELPTHSGTLLLRGRASAGGKMLASASLYLKVASAATRKPLRVLVVGSPQWANPVAEYIEGFGAKVTRAISDNTVIRPIKFPRTPQELRRDYDVVWLAGYDNYWREAPDALTSTILAAVKTGTTFVHTGSPASFHGGGGDLIGKDACLDLTPLADVLPVIVRHENDAYFSSTFRAGQLLNPFSQRAQLRVAATDEAPPWLRLANFTGAEVDDFNILDARPGSKVLVKLGNVPLLVSGRYGKGRVIAYMGFSPEGSPTRLHTPLILDRALQETPAKHTFGVMSAVILALASGEDPPVSIDSLIEEQVRPVFEPMLTSDPAPPKSVQVTWSHRSDGAVVGHVRIENGDEFSYGLRIRLTGPNGNTDHSLALWGNQFFDLLPHEIVDTDVTVLRSTTSPPDQLWVTTETIAGRETPRRELRVPL